MNCTICGRKLGTSLQCECDNPRGLTYVPTTSLKQVPTVANMTLRDYMAIHAPSICDDPNDTMTKICRYRYVWADEMLAAREVKP